MPVAPVLQALVALFFIAFASLPVQAQELLAVPALTARVLDTTGTLSAEQTARLEAQLQQLEQERGAQVVVLMVPSTAPEDIAAYANRVGNTWKLGRREVGDGLIVLVAQKDRRMRIEVAKALEGAVPDIAAKRIIDEAMAPRFRQGDFAGGLGAAVQQIAARLGSGDLAPVDAAAGAAPTAQAQGADGIDAVTLVFIALFAMPFASVLAREIFGATLGALLVGAAVGGITAQYSASMVLVGSLAVLGFFLALLIGGLNALGSRSGLSRSRSGSVWSSGGSSSGSSSWESSNSSSSGFDSGGGGDFGGGGASGDW